MRMRIILSWMLAAVVLATGALGADKGDIETVKVGVCLSFTGEFAAYGEANLAGMRLFVDDFNARADDYGFKIHLVVRDDESNPKKAAAVVDELALNHDIQIIVGGVTSNMLLAMVERAKVYKVVLVSPAATSPLVGKRDDWAFKILPGDSSQGRALAKFFAGQMGASRAAIASNEFFAYGTDTMNAFRQAFEQAGGSVVAEERYSWDSPESEDFDFKDVIRRLQSREPEVVLLTGYAKEAAAFIRQTGEGDWRPIFCGGDAWLNIELLYTAGDRLDDSYYVGGADIYSGSPEAKRFVELMDSSEDPHLQTYSSNGYDAIAVAAEALKSGNRSALAIRERLYTLKDFPLVSGKLTFDPRRGTIKTLYIYRIGKMAEGFFSEVVAEVQPE